MAPSKPAASSPGAPVVIGFGETYFHNMGGAKQTAMGHASDLYSNDSAGFTDESTQSSTQSDVNQRQDDDNDNDAAAAATTTTAASSNSSLARSVTAHIFHSESKEQDQQQQQQPMPWAEDDSDPDNHLIQVACSFSGSLFLTKQGKVFTCGTLHGHVRQSPTRTIIPLPLKCVQLAAGRHFCLARMEGGLAVCSWGAGHFGQLGQGTYGQKNSGGGGGGGGDDSDSDESSGPSSLHFYDHPTVVEGLLPAVIGSPVTHVAAGAWHALAVSQSGQVWAWGCNRNHQCGRKKPSGASSAPGSANSAASSPPPTILSPQLVPNLENCRIIKVDGGRSHSVALDDKGAVYCWGASSYGQCSGSSASRRRGGVVPARAVDALSKVHIVDVAAGDAHTLALTGGGRVFAWGAGGEGQLGQGTCIPGNPKPKLVSDLDFVAIEAGREWKQQQSSTPKSQSGLANVPKIVSIAAAGNYSLATSSSGHVYAWGCNDVGNLGLPLSTASNLPDDLPFVEPGLPPTNKSTLRQLENTTFDSRHNIALPQRLDALSAGYMVQSCAVGPTHMWCLATKRTPAEQAMPIGRTLYEVQESRRQKVLRKMNSPRLSASAPLSGQPDPPGNKSLTQFDTVVPPRATSPSKSKSPYLPDADNSMVDLNMMEASQSQIEDFNASMASMGSPAAGGGMAPSTPIGARGSLGADSPMSPGGSGSDTLASPTHFRSPSSGKMRRRFGPIHLIRKFRSKDKDKDKDNHAIQEDSEGGAGDGGSGKKSSRKFFH